MIELFYELLFAPFIKYHFMSRALVAVLSLAMGCAPLGVLLVVRRMSLMGDALSHAILPGAAIGFLISGLSLPAMTLGGFIAGLMVALLAGLVTRMTTQREDASFAAFYLISLALGVLIVSMRGSNVDLLHILFGTVLAVDNASLILVSTITTIILITLSIIYRPLIIECFDPSFLIMVNGGGGIYHLIFLVLVVLNLIAGFQALGTLLSVGLMMLPAITARFWGRELWSIALIAFIIAFSSGWLGLAISFYYNLPSGPTIILAAGILYLISLLSGRYDSLLARYFRHRHLSA